MSKGKGKAPLSSDDITKDKADNESDEKSDEKSNEESNNNSSDTQTDRDKWENENIENKGKKRSYWFWENYETPAESSSAGAEREERLKKRIKELESSENSNETEKKPSNIMDNKNLNKTENEANSGEFSNNFTRKEPWKEKSDNLKKNLQDLKKDHDKLLEKSKNDLTTEEEEEKITLLEDEMTDINRKISELKAFREKMQEKMLKEINEIRNNNFKPENKEENNKNNDKNDNSKNDNDNDDDDNFGDIFG